MRRLERAEIGNIGAVVGGARDVVTREAPGVGRGREPVVARVERRVRGTSLSAMVCTGPPLEASAPEGTRVSGLLVTEAKMSASTMTPG